MHLPVVIALMLLVLTFTAFAQLAPGSSTGVAPAPDVQSSTLAPTTDADRLRKQNASDPNSANPTSAGAKHNDAGWAEWEAQARIIDGDYDGAIQAQHHADSVRHEADQQAKSAPNE